MHYFGVKNDPIGHYFGKILNISFVYTLAPFIVLNFQKILTANREDLN